VHFVISRFIFVLPYIRGEQEKVYQGYISAAVLKNKLGGGEKKEKKKKEELVFPAFPPYQGRKSLMAPIFHSGY